MIVYDGKLTKLCDKAMVSWSKIAKENGWFDPGRPFYVQVPGRSRHLQDAPR